MSASTCSNGRPRRRTETTVPPGIAPNGARGARDAGRAPERGHRETRRTGGGAQGAGGFGEARGGKVVHGEIIAPGCDIYVTGGCASAGE